MALEEGAPGVNRVFYLALPPQEHQWAETVSETTAASPNGWWVAARKSVCVFAEVEF